MLEVWERTVKEWERSYDALMCFLWSALLMATMILNLWFWFAFSAAVVVWYAYPVLKESSPDVSR